MTRTIQPRRSLQDLRAFAKKLKNYRLQSNLTQKELARKLGCSPTSIQYWEAALCWPSLKFRQMVALWKSSLARYLFALEPKSQPIVAEPITALQVVDKGETAEPFTSPQVAKAKAEGRSVTHQHDEPQTAALPVLPACNSCGVRSKLTERQRTQLENLRRRLNGWYHDVVAQRPDLTCDETMCIQFSVGRVETAEDGEPLFDVSIEREYTETGL